MEFGNQIEYVMSYSIYKHEATLKMAFEAIFWRVNFLVDPLQLAFRELQCVLQYRVINKNIAFIQLILVFILHFSVVLAQNTTGITTTTTMAAAGGNGPLAPHMRPCTPHRCFEWMGDTRKWI